jgi:hypothetical protein
MNSREFKHQALGRTKAGEVIRALNGEPGTRRARLYERRNAFTKPFTSKLKQINALTRGESTAGCC